MPDENRMTEDSRPPMPDERISYAALLLSSAAYADARADEHAQSATALPIYEEAARSDAAALRALAGLVAEIEQGNSDDHSPEDFCNRIAAGFDPAQDQEGR